MRKVLSMKKLLLYVTAILLLFAACNKEEKFIYGGRYYGTFTNTTNNITVDGSLSFTFDKPYDLDSIIRIDTLVALDSILTVDTVTLSIGGIPATQLYDTTYTRDTFFNIIHPKDGITSFLLNHLVKLDTIKTETEAKFITYYTADPLSGPNLEMLLKTMPAIDKLDICDPTTDTIISMKLLRAKFEGNNVESTIEFTTTKNNNPVEIIFKGSVFE